ncbi:MAG: hypothetical protein JSU73_09400 [candidate division WOR-3 bacterium]|nr:MAG: hypothetical protein JSU73_09400 [candidate division WOR-3 bacterium]
MSIFGVSFRAILTLVLVVFPVARAGVDGLTFLGHNEENGAHLMDAEIVGNRVVICNGLGGGGMEVYDITNPAEPRRVWAVGRDAWRARSYGDTLVFLFSRQQGVQRYYFPETGNPEFRGLYDPPGSLEALEGGALIGNMLYTAAHQNGLYAIDFGESGPPRKVDELDLGPSQAWNVEEKDSFLFVANGQFGLKVVELNQGMQVVASVDLPGTANDIVLDGDVAAVSIGGNGLATVDISDPYDPRLLDIAGTEGSVWGIGITGHLVVAGSWRVMELFDISDPEQVERVGWDNTKTWAHGADIREDSIVAVADWRGMSIYRVGNDPGPDIDVMPEVMDFGGGSHQRDTVVYVRNTGTSPLVVSSINVPNEIAASPTSFTVPPGDSQAVLLEARGNGSVSNHVTFFSNDPDEQGWQMEVHKNNANFPQAGSAAPDFSLLGTDERRHSISGNQGKVIYLQFGASW